MAAPDTLTISAAARLCGCSRSTLQRAVRAGRLHLDPDHCLSVAELTEVGYLRTPAAQPQHAPAALQAIQDFYALLRAMQQSLEQITERLAALQEAVQQLRQERATSTPLPPGRTRQPRRMERTLEPDACPPFDPARNVLGKLCPRGHEWGRTGQSLLRLPNQSCRACENQVRREKRAARQQPPP